MTATNTSRSESRDHDLPAARRGTASAWVAAARSIVRDVFGDRGSRGFGVRYWDGTTEGSSDGVPFTVVIRQPGALRRMLLPPSELALVEAYLSDDVDIEGSLEAAAGLGDMLSERLRSAAVISRVARAALTLPRPALLRGEESRTWSAPTRRLHSSRRDAAAVRFHYDVGNDFYALWLDPRMQYSCAYFRAGDESIAVAQEAKLDHICRKLRLRPADRLLDIGCGWGGLLEYAAQNYGVVGVGITLSEAQASAARARFAAAGLSDRCRVEIRHYRDIPAAWQFEKVVSVGMREHVGRRHLPQYFATAHAALVPGGLFLDHGIVRGRAGADSSAASWIEARLWRRDAFITRYIFPDGELQPTGTIVALGEGAGLEARDVESLREHYALTLRHWLRRLEDNHAAAAASVGESTYRAWQLYMAGSARGFSDQRLAIIQTLFAKPAASPSPPPVPLTRADIYR
ncbi:MAG: class I SAM-dependent methyltransferase [Gemmatimonadaceae bacterium]